MTTHKGGAPRKFDRKLAARMYFEDKLDSIEIAAKLESPRRRSPWRCATPATGCGGAQGPTGDSNSTTRKFRGGRAYRSGLSLAQVGSKVGAKPSTLAWRLRQAGVEIRPRSARLEKPHDRDVVRNPE